MPATNETVDQVVQARLILGVHRFATLRVTLRYRAGDPLAVRMAFPAEYALDSAEALEPSGLPDVEWVFGRDLLSAGLDRAAGLGDVRVRPAPGRFTMVELHAPEGAALLQFETAALQRFLWRTFLAVPEGCELRHLDSDRALTELLG